MARAKTTGFSLPEDMQADLEAVGIPVTLAPKPFAEYRTFAVSGGAPLAREVQEFGAPSLITRGTNDVTQVQMLVLMELLSSTLS